MAQITIGDGTAASCNYQALLNAINKAVDNDIITFKCPANHIINLDAGLVLTKPLTFDGSNSPGLIISGQNKYRIFKTNKNLTLKNLTLQGGRFSDLASTEPEGGAVRMFRGTLTLDGVICKDNFAPKGGAISGAFEAVVNIKNCVFENNKAHNGGAVFTNTTDFSIEGSTFKNNSTTAAGTFDGSGGALQNFSVFNVKKIVINNCRFEGNTAYNEAGAASLNVANGVTLEMQNTSFVNNQVLKNSTTGIGSAGALKIAHKGTKSTATLTNVAFYKNAVDKEGGALWTGGASADLNLTLNRVTFANNISGRIPDPEHNETGGGAILINNGDNAVITLKNCTIAYNEATHHETSGAIYVERPSHDKFIVTDTIFHLNCSKKALGNGDANNCKHFVHTNNRRNSVLVSFNDQGTTNNYEYPENGSLYGEKFPLSKNSVVKDVQVKAFQDSGKAMPIHPTSLVNSGSGAT